MKTILGIRTNGTLFLKNGVFSIIGSSRELISVSIKNLIKFEVLVPNETELPNLHPFEYYYGRQRFLLYHKIASYDILSINKLPFSNGW